MLISFRVENFLSFNKKQEFSMLAGQSQKLKHHIWKTPKSEVNILKSAILYGANASGKSNFIKAIDFARKTILDGTTISKLFNAHFRLAANKSNESSTFEFEIQIEGVIYAYGFDIILKDKIIVEEWLYRVGKTTDKPLFVRKTQKDGSVVIDLKINFENAENRLRVKYIGLDTLPTQLFLTEINHRNVKKIKEIHAFFAAYQWFENVLTVLQQIPIYHRINLSNNEDFIAENFTKFLKVFDTGIQGVQIQKENLKEVLNIASHELRKKIIEQMTFLNPNGRFGVLIGNNYYNFYKNGETKIEVVRLLTKHENQNNEIILFDIGDESDGTQRIFDLIPILMTLSAKQKVIFIDELDRSLHPLLTKKIIEIFLKNALNTPSQLIVTTHESSLLNLKFLRRDELWFVKKNKLGESELYSLEEFKPRHDKEIRKGYLYGRFGGIPELGELEELEIVH